MPYRPMRIRVPRKMPKVEKLLVIWFAACAVVAAAVFATLAERGILNW